MIESKIHQHMEVIGSCGSRIGSVASVEGRLMNLAETDSADGRDHAIPMAWVTKVDERVHLSRTCDEVIHQRKSAPPERQNVSNSENAQY
jgi:hypothetical protein